MSDVSASNTPAKTTKRPRRKLVKVAEVVARQILHDIVDRELEPGAKLPSEVEMAETHGVARGSLLEALRILEIHGLITLKPGPGGGPVVAAINSEDLGQTLTFFLQASGATFRELMQARLVLEPLMARAAAEHGDRDVHAALTAGIERSRGVLNESDGEYLDVATDFHGVVSGASGNGILDLLARSLKDIYVARIRSIVYEPDERAKLLHDHEVVADAIISGDGDEAERLMRDHMQEYVEIMEDRFTGFMDERIDWF
jgi:GntR family transcriptional repressor for pyruvate dehydrogenase complex